MFPLNVDANPQNYTVPRPVKADSHIAAVPMPFPCHTVALTV